MTLKVELTKMDTGKSWVFGVTILTSLLLIAVALSFWGAAEIRANFGEVFFLTLVAAVWLILSAKFFAWLGLSFRDDVVERRNTAALVALCGAEAGAAAIYAGGSLGEGPSYWNNVFSAGLAMAGFVALWILVEWGTGISFSITEERDMASGIRACGFLLALGLVLGRAVAGDWHSESATVHDFIHDGWPTLVISGVAVFVERFAQPSRRRPFPPWPQYGLLPALLYLALAAAWLWRLGPWEGMHP